MTKNWHVCATCCRQEVNCDVISGRSLNTIVGYIPVNFEVVRLVVFEILKNHFMTAEAAADIDDRIKRKRIRIPLKNCRYKILSKQVFLLYMFTRELANWATLVEIAVWSLSVGRIPFPPLSNFVARLAPILTETEMTRRPERFESSSTSQFVSRPISRRTMDKTITSWLK